MTNGTQTTVSFTCPCGMNYTATREERTSQHSGNFDCEDCRKPVHEWTGFYDLFDWKAVSMRPLRPGSKI